MVVCNKCNGCGQLVSGQAAKDTNGVTSAFMPNATRIGNACTQCRGLGYVSGGSF